MAKPNKIFVLPGITICSAIDHAGRSAWSAGKSQPIFMLFKIVNLNSCFGWPEGYAQEQALTSSLPVEWVMKKVVTEDEIIAASHEADVVLVERFSTQITRGVIDALDRCRLIAKYAIGVDNIDTAAATERGIVVCNAADYCGERSRTGVLGSAATAV